MKLCDRYYVEQDKYQYILVEKILTAEGSRHKFSERRTYHGTLLQVAEYISNKEQGRHETVEELAGILRLHREELKEILS